jgi:predicted nucleic acid-binding protein
VRRATPVFVSELTRVEVISAIQRKSRDGQLTAVNAASLVAAFEHDLIEADGPTDAVFTVLRLGSEVLDEAVSILDRHPLRAADAIQLATAMVARRVLPALTTFLSFDRRLAEAAAAEGFANEPVFPKHHHSP